MIPGSSTLCSLGLPPHVGRGDAAAVRSTRSESFFDLITKLRAGLRSPSRFLSFRKLALAYISRHSFGNLTPRKKPRFWKFPGKSDLRRRVGWVQYAPTRRSRSVSYVSPFGTQRCAGGQRVSLVGLRPPPRFRWVGQHPTFLLRGSTILAPRGMSSSESSRDRLRRLRKRGSS